MKVPHSWLAEFVPGLPGPRETADALVRAGLPPASVVPFTSAYSGVVVGLVRAAEKHPNADRLSLCEVEAGGEVYKVVCGAPNVRAGMKAPLALVGARLPGGKNITAAVIRNVPSQGMLCSAVELGMGADAGGIMDLPGDPATGEPFIPNPEDWVLDVEVTPNRGDALSIVGIARSVAGVLGLEWKYPWKAAVPAEAGQSGGGWTVAVEDQEGCGIYTGILLESVNIVPSPDWMQKRLLACDLRPISNVVDITNYVLLELGHPLHAFDAAKVAGKRIVVRRAAAGEKMHTLDGVERKLTPETLVIADSSGPVAVAGVMGGASSEISGSTSAVFLEAAWFDPVRVRRGSRELGLKSESSYRFERGVDFGGVAFASARAVALMAEMAWAKPATGLLVARGKLPTRPSITVSDAEASSALGAAVTAADIAKYCRLVGAEAKESGGGRFAVVPPTWRLDIREPADLLEEFAILAGYDRIPATMPMMRSSGLARPRAERLQEAVESALLGAGFSEAKTFSFMSQADARLVYPDGDPRGTGVPLLNPMTEDMGLLRTAILPGLLRSVQYNLAREAPGAMLFETGRVFRDSGAGKAPGESDSLCLAVAGRVPKGIHEPERTRDFTDLKGGVEAVGAALGIALEWAVGDRPPFARGRCAIITAGGKEVGSAGVLTTAVAKAFDLPAGACSAELDWGVLLALAAGVPRVAEPPRFPAVRRDLAVVVDRVRTAGDLEATARKAGAPLLESVTVFDSYEGKQVPEGKKSLAFRLAFRSGERTLTEAEADKALQGIVAALGAEHGAQIRAS